MAERWKQINGYPDYWVSAYGRVKSMKYMRERILKKCITHHKYARVCLRNKNGKKWFNIHRLVLCTFMDKPLDYHMYVCHYDDNKLNNVIDNLWFGTPQDNMTDKMDKGRHFVRVGDEHYISILKSCEIPTIRQLWLSGKYTQRELGKKYNVHAETIGNVVRYETWKHI